MEEKSIFIYAKELEKNKHFLTFCDAYTTLLKGLNCVVCLESAADLLGYSNGGYRKKIKVYSEKNLKKPYLQCFIVDNINDIPYIDYHGVKTSPINIAINDMLERKETNDQILYETFANYYCENNNTYKGLNIPKKLKLKAKHFKKEGKLYYEQ